jgi:hypothetical protein
LKLQTASGWGMTRLKEQLNELERLNKNSNQKEVIALDQSFIRDINLSLDMQLFKSIKDSIR